MNAKTELILVKWQRTLSEWIKMDIYVMVRYKLILSVLRARVVSSTLSEKLAIIKVNFLWTKTVRWRQHRTSPPWPPRGQGKMAVVTGQTWVGVWVCHLLLLFVVESWPLWKGKGLRWHQCCCCCCLRGCNIFTSQRWNNFTCLEQLDFSQDIYLLY